MALLTALAIAAPSFADRVADAEETGWPCVQRLVPTMAIGQVWPGQLPAADAGSDNLTVQRLAAEIAVRRTSLEDARVAIVRFAKGLEPHERAETLGSLINQALKRINAERASLIAGIKRFAARQRALAERIRERRHTLDKKTADDPDRAELEEAVSWDQRVFDEREDSLTYLCEQPVLLEQRAFMLGREIYSHVEGS